MRFFIQKFGSNLGTNNHETNRHLSIRPKLAEGIKALGHKAFKRTETSGFEELSVLRRSGAPYMLGQGSKRSIGEHSSEDNTSVLAQKQYRTKLNQMKERLKLMYGVGLSHFANSIQAAVTIENTKLTDIPEPTNKMIEGAGNRLGQSFIDIHQEKDKEAQPESAGETTSLKTSIDHTEGEGSNGEFHASADEESGMSIESEEEEMEDQISMDDDDLRESQ